MICVQELCIEEFRGIRTLTLELAGKNFAISGPNGTGKSGIVDAIEFALTGTITRLTGEGTDNITVRAHAPHVDHRTHPEISKVVLKAYIPALDKTVTIERTVESPSTPNIDSSDPAVIAIVKALEEHPEFALSRREIIKYVLTPPGARSKQIQALLRLERVEKVRQSFQGICNSLKTDARQIEQDLKQAETQLLRALRIPQLSKEQILTEVNKRRQILHLDILGDLTKDTSLKAGIVSLQKIETVTQKIVKKQALADLTVFAEKCEVAEQASIAKSRAEVVVILTKLVESPSLLRSLRREDFLRSGLELIDLDSCPFCGNEWDIPALQLHVQQSLEEAEQATKLRRDLGICALPLIDALTEFENLANSIAGYGRQLIPPADVSALTGFISTLKLRRQRTANLENIQESIVEFSEDYRQIPETALECVSAIWQAIQILPDPSEEEEAKDYLTVCQERLEIYQERKRKQQTIKSQSDIANKVLGAYNSSVTTVLSKIYDAVERDFTTYYCFINREDEAEFKGKLTPSPGKLGFDVEFYGRGFFPPGAYHSEGHQDAMGLCLYLALMKHTLGAQFTFAVLDDVLMSVDAGHRREVCSLIKKEFPDTQFILTTHDQIWLNHLVSEHVIARKAFANFRKWTIDDGPLIWDNKDVWKEIESCLDRNDVSNAAGLLRKFLEYTYSLLAGRLRARIEFKCDGQNDLGDFLPSVIETWNNLLKKAQVAANSWNQRDVKDRLSIQQEEFRRCVDQSQFESWAINSSIHYNPWATLQKEDFIPVVNAAKSLLACFCCHSCNEFTYVTPPKGSRENVRCDCGQIIINLKPRT